MPQDYTLSDAQKALQTDNKMLQKWMDEAVQSGEPLRPHLDIKNRRRKLLTRAQVERLAALHGRTLPPDTPVADPLIALETRLRCAEAQLAALSARIARLETPPAVPAPVAHSEAQQTAVPAQPVVLYPLARMDVQKTLARPKHKAFTVAWRAREWLALHGVSPRSMEGWQELPLETYAAVLDYAKAQGARLGRCGDDACPCRDLLD